MSFFSHAPELLDVAVRLGRALEARGLMVVTAESCTGGLIAAALTETAGSSVWFERGFVTYSNAAKQAQLGVPADVLAGHGAVSEPVAQAMALGALAASRASIALSVTGVAGPGGGTAAKPVGTVCFGWAVAGVGVESHTRHFSGDRSSVRMQSARYALEHALAMLPAMAAASEQQPMRSDALAKKD